jgi:HlyD family type I secretion membrane fusion protein
MKRRHGERPALAPVGVRGPLMLAALLTLASFGGAAAWSTLADLESAVIAPGVLVVDSNRKTVQHLDGGTVAELLVREGDTVAAGQPLIRLDRTVAEATLDLLRGQLDASLALAARLAAERDGRAAITFPGALAERAAEPNLAELMTAERRVFAARREQVESQTRILRQRNVQTEEQIRGILAEMKAQDRQLKLLGEETDAVAEMVSKGLNPKPKLLALQRQSAELEGARAHNLAAVAQAQQQIGEGELRIVDLQAQFLSEAVQKLRDEQAKIFDLAQRIRAAEDTLTRTEIRAPASGRIVGLKVFTVGGVITPRDPLMDIVPQEDVLVVDAQVAVNDIDVVRVGLPVQLRFSALNQRTTPTIDGTVSKVAADRSVDQRTGQPSYTVRVAVDSTERLPKNVALQPGMPVETMIRTGSRSFLNYIAKPIADFASRALREG